VEFCPVFGLLGFSGEEVTSGLNDLFSNSGQETQDLFDGSLVGVGGELGHGGNQWGVDGVLLGVLVEAFLNGVEVGLELDEAGSGLQVLNQTNGSVNGDNGCVVVFQVLNEILVVFASGGASLGFSLCVDFKVSLGEFEGLGCFGLEVGVDGQDLAV